MEKNKKNQTKRKSVKKKKNSSKSRFVLIGAVLSTVIIILFATVFFTTDKVIEGDEMSSENSEILSAVSSDEMGFPVTFSNNDILQCEAFSSRIFVLGKKILTCVSAEGRIKYNKIFTFTQPEMAVSDKYGIVYDRASSKYFIFTHRGVIYEGESENGKHIITAKINNQGDVALVTKSDDSACRVYLTDKKGEVKYIWSCAEEYAVCLDIDQSGEDILCGTIGSENGIVYSKLYLLNIYSDSEKAEYYIDGSAVVDVSLSGRRLIASCDDGRYIFNTRKDSEKAETQVEYSSKIIGISADESGNTAVVTNKAGTFGTNEITVYNKNNEISYRGHTDETIVDVLCRGKRVYLLTDTAIFDSQSDGTFKKVSSEEISGEGMVICKSRLYYYSTGQIDINS